MAPPPPTLPPPSLTASTDAPPNDPEDCATDTTSTEPTSTDIDAALTDLTENLRRLRDSDPDARQLHDQLTDTARADTPRDSSDTSAEPLSPPPSPDRSASTPRAGDTITRNHSTAGSPRRDNGNSSNTSSNNDNTTATTDDHDNWENRRSDLLDKLDKAADDPDARDLAAALRNNDNSNPEKSNPRNGEPEKNRTLNQESTSPSAASPPDISTKPDDTHNDAPNDTDTRSRPRNSTTSSSSETWDQLAECESSGNWAANTGNGYHGGLQFDKNTWAAYGGTEHAPTADQATPDQQIAIAEKLRADRGGYSAWPACARKLNLPK
ncbi:transglycosylase family protein [Pseudonocardia sp. ICBG601]|uniref:transglycosylase family protein n=1 Tax=Pseudonocardia sp. ICBG601 TaxID=2846759 RepID=UPI0035AC21BD